MFENAESLLGRFLAPDALHIKQQQVVLSVLDIRQSLDVVPLVEIVAVAVKEDFVASPSLAVSADLDGRAEPRAARHRSV